MICSLSGKETENPVVSPKSGAIFDRHLIEKYLISSGTDPINDEPLTVEELITVQSAEKLITPIKPVSHNSIPALLSTFQNEWDALSIEVFTLRKQLQKAREELSAALYHHDATVRVSARLLKERDEARKALQDLTLAIGEGKVPSNEVKSSSNDNNDVIESKNAIIPKQMADKINEARSHLFTLHKSTKITLVLQNPPILNEVENLSLPFGNGATSYFDSSTNSLFVGSSTGSIAVIDESKACTQFEAKSHSKVISISTVQIPQISSKEVPLIACEKSNITAFVDGSEVDIIVDHNQDQDIIQVVTHPSLRSMFVVFSKDGTWSLNDTSLINSDRCTTVFKSESLNINCGDIHVDGALIAVGTNDGQVVIFDLTTGKQVSAINTKYSQVSNLKFALNGYWLLVSSTSMNDSQSSIEVIDLRKAIIIHTIDVTDLFDFAIDASSTTLLTLNQSNVSLHKYTKKGKLWTNNVNSYAVDSSIRKLEIKQQKEGLEIFGITGNDKVEQYWLN